jgi:hypothetical protein
VVQPKAGSYFHLFTAVTAFTRGALPLSGWWSMSAVASPGRTVLVRSDSVIGTPLWEFKLGGFVGLQVHESSGTDQIPGLEVVTPTPVPKPR